MSEVGERMAALEASFRGFEKYTHERWHDLANDLQPLVRLPEQMARDFGKMEGRMDGKLNAAVDSIKTAVKDDIDKLASRVDGHDDEIGEIKIWQSRWTAGKVTILVVGQAMLNAIVAIATVLSVTGRH